VPASPADTQRVLRWEYQWEDSLNALSERAVEPVLPTRIVGEVVRAATASSPSCVIFVRGELGIGKSTLAILLIDELKSTAESEPDPTVRNALLTCAVLEAEDLETPQDFAVRVNQALAPQSPVVALARPGTLDAASQWIHRVPDAAVTMRPFEAGRPLFHECLEHVAESVDLIDPGGRDQLRALAGRLPSFLQTPFYFEQLANAIRSSPMGTLPTGRSPLEIFHESIERRIGGDGRFKELVECAIGTRLAEDIPPVAGIIDREGFRHDGYRNVVLAASVIANLEPFESMARARNALPAVRIILDHVEHVWRGSNLDLSDHLLAQLRTFVVGEDFDRTVPYVVYVQGLVAVAFRRLREEEPATVLRERCLALIRARTDPDATVSPGQWWDVSDALSLVGDPRLQQARRTRYASTSGYFTQVDNLSIRIGSEQIPARRDDAKPVLPYRPTTVSVGPLWVSNFLVTNDQFAEFWGDDDRGDFFRATGEQWYKGDSSLIEEIEAAFDVAANRCFWKETKEQHQVAVAGLSAASMSILEIARSRALRSDRVKLWDPTQADDRFSASGNPVVGINWWEAMAFCAWWTERRLPDGDFPSGATASLLTDWEWEALRRHYYEDVASDQDHYPEPTYPAHLRNPSSNRAARGRLTNVMRPLHVGLAPVPHEPGPFDMVGNVWEWTRSRVFGRIVPCSAADGAYGETAWDDIDPNAERNPTHPERDIVDDTSDLTYRAVRGGSFFSIDQQAAWHPAYRLCDPPFSSYFDLGFRFAVYPKEATET